MFKTIIHQLIDENTRIVIKRTWIFLFDRMFFLQRKINGKWKNITETWPILFDEEPIEKLINHLLFKESLQKAHKTGQYDYISHHFQHNESYSKNKFTFFNGYKK
jgi:hypothetical protein